MLNKGKKYNKYSSELKQKYVNYCKNFERLQYIGLCHLLK